ncbi:3-isopropylmalate dehydratase small subunit [Actinokineospora spheciospongiae]|uniref:3-isopropylmalate dehydratase small subunit n=1 Tax=Actinokineospora spheciospongiae TaxID=909613 RepID=W7J257_9PSEU|nr:aconitate hydratase [Actinokineospora spheciospongiae]EWC60214.1 3-isopropylmalate dehydratase small subunit [Actinokineospora spheciospongiae]PWW51960.1 homoaconitase small subunit [Actinokineospora spheciospongiae]
MTSGTDGATGPVEGRVWRFGDDVNTDVIHPPAFYSLDPDKVRRGLFHGYDPTIARDLRPGDVFVAGRNFGCGSSRETSIRAIKLNEVGAVVAVDFARIFFRNATNNGLPCLTFARPADLELVEAGTRVVLDPVAATLTCADGTVVELVPPGEFVREIWAAGGLLNLLPTGMSAPES